MHSHLPWCSLRRCVGAALLVSVVACQDSPPTPEPVPDPTPLTVTALRVGNVMGCARRAADGVWGCWGLDAAQRFGLGPGSDTDTARYNRPFTPLPSPVAFTDVVLGGLHTCALDATGQTWCWGNNYQGLTGTGSVDPVVDHPLPVQGGLRFRALFSAGSPETTATCGLTDADETYCWGANNSFGVLGTGDLVAHPAPTRLSVPPLQGLVLGYAHACGLAQDGVAWCWGDNETRQIVDTAVSPLLQPTPAGAPHRFRALAVGRWSSCGVSVEGPTYCWGLADGGVLGPGAPRTPTAVPQLVVRDTVFVDLVSDKHQQFFGRTADGRVFRWGDSGGDTELATPTEMLPGTRFREVGAGLMPMPLGNGGACGVAEDGVVVCVKPLSQQVAVLTDSVLVMTTTRGTVPFPERP